MCKGRSGDLILVDDFDREWDDVETEVYIQLLQHGFTPIISETEALHQLVSLAAGQTLGMTLRPRSGGCDGRDSNDGFGSD